MEVIARYAQPWIDRAARIGADPQDDDDVRLRKTLLVVICLLILPIGRRHRLLRADPRHGDVPARRAA
jgi:hypothetical protein